MPKVASWAFYLGDLLLLSFAGLMVYMSRWPMSAWVVVASGVAVLAGAWLAVTPAMLEYRALLKGLEIDALVSTVSQIKKLELLSTQIAHATSQWQAAHDLAEKNVRTANDITNRMAAEAKAFAEFLQKANDAEKGHLRLEVDKLRRAEVDWLKITTAILDHVYALHQAGLRSGQAGLIEQLARFQEACRDAARRVGLVPFLAAVDGPFDPDRHQLLNGQTAPPCDARVIQTVATGYTFQGQLIRPALVELRASSPSSDSLETENQPPVASEQSVETESPIPNADPPAPEPTYASPLSGPAAPSSDSAAVLPVDPVPSPADPPAESAEPLESAASPDPGASAVSPALRRQSQLPL